MVSLLLAARISPSRVGAVINRNVGALRSGPSYWLVLLSGFFEPVLYLLSIGVGVGALVGDLTLPGGRVVEYAVFVAPAMLAVSAMSGALSETTFNFFFKMKYSKTFDAVLATPVKPFEIALGELAWAMVRSSVYTGAFLVVMVALGLTGPGWALAAFPATMLVGLAFGAVGMAISTFMRGWQDFDLLTTGQFALFLFSGTFSPVQDYPAVVEVLVRLTPLYHAVELVRGLVIGELGWGLLGNAAYLLAMVAAGLTLAARRIHRTLCA
ncbi:ABC transporter permease [Streptosporangium lutulentum]|uniref:Transport permease protein n=1 Tax=Streptosporangium lutulentum TaxID=1461250 RepID=A0ABT9Q8X6_9ACTN|nr:ABC transporter permease [Streptosporangium lutulentum]MDP9843207.1 lipooligosaccharide transport system permease protein [Streptosporangium lutulentum]